MKYCARGRKKGLHKISEANVHTSKSTMKYLGKTNEGSRMAHNLKICIFLKNLWRDLKHAIHISELEVFCQEESGKIPKSKD